MRKLCTLYRIVLEEAPIRGRGVDYGLCHMIQDGKYTGNKDHLTEEEQDKLIRHMNTLRPNRTKSHPFRSFAYDVTYKWNYNEGIPFGSYWWLNNEKGKEQRILFLEALIEYTTPWYVKLWRQLNYFDVFTSIYMK